MATKDRRHLINVHSSMIDKVPEVAANDMRYGELAVNHFKGKAFISTRVSETEMELFPSIKYIEQYPFSSLKVSGDTNLSGDTYIEHMIPGDKTFDNKMDENSLNAVQNSVITKTILDNEKTVSASLNDLNERVIDLSGKSITTITGDDFITATTSDNTDGTKQTSLSISYDTELSTASTNSVQNKVITQVIYENEKAISSSLNDLNVRKADYSGITGDEAISVMASSCNDISLKHKEGVQKNQAGVGGTDGDLTVDQTDEFGHIIASRKATAADIEKLGVASKGLTIKYGETKPTNNALPGSFTRTEKTYDGKTPMTLVVPQKITDLEGGSDLAYVHLSGDTMTGDLKISKAGSSNNVLLSANGLSASSTADIAAGDSKISLSGNGISINKDTTVSGKLTATNAIYSSDERLKDKISSICTCKLDKVSNINLKEFYFKNDDSKRQRYGVIAQDLQNAGLGNLVEVDKDGYLGVDYISFLILKIAEMDNEIKNLKNTINELNSKSK